LFSLLVLCATVYFGVNIGEVYWRFYEYQDTMRQAVRFAAHSSDDQIKRRLAATADSLGLPEPAGRVFVRRQNRDISIEASYYEHLELPLIVREVQFNPRATGSF
jgi:hypothetical protein